jgi:hypothetical protein
MLLTIGEEIGRLVLTEPDAYTPSREQRSIWRLLEVIATPGTELPHQPSA